MKSGALARQTPQVEPSLLRSVPGWGLHWCSWGTLPGSQTFPKLFPKLQDQLRPQRSPVLDLPTRRSSGEGKARCVCCYPQALPNR